MRSGRRKAKHLTDILIRQIEDHNILSAQQWENRISPDIKLQLLREFGLSVDGYIQRLIRLTRANIVTQNYNTNVTTD
jgi:hypothetical protein